MKTLLNHSAKLCLCRGSGTHIHLSNVCWQCSFITIMITREEVLCYLFLFVCLGGVVRGGVVSCWVTKWCLDFVRELHLISGHKFILYLPGHFPENNRVQWACFACVVIFLKVRKLKQLLTVQPVLLNETSDCFSHYLITAPPLSG